MSLDDQILEFFDFDISTTTNFIETFANWPDDIIVEQTITQEVPVPKPVSSATSSSSSSSSTTATRRKKFKIIKPTSPTRPIEKPIVKISSIDQITEPQQQSSKTI